MALPEPDKHFKGIFIYENILNYTIKRRIIMSKRNLTLAALALVFLVVISAAACRKDPEEETGENTLPEYIATIPSEDIDYGVEP